MIIKATRLQAWAPAGGWARVGCRPPPLEKKYKKLAILGTFLLLFLHMGAFLLRFSHFGGLFTMWGPFRYFLLHGGGLFLGFPPPPTNFFAGARDCKKGSRACSRENFLCDRNLVSSGHVLLRFCLKNDKNNDKL